MAKKQSNVTESDKAINQVSKSLAIANAGIRTGQDFANLMSALMSDLVGGRITPNIANATCNAAGKLLKVVEMQHKYGKTGGSSPEDMLKLASM